MLTLLALTAAAAAGPQTPGPQAPGAQDVSLAPVRRAATGRRSLTSPNPPSAGASAGNSASLPGQSDAPGRPYFGPSTYEIASFGYTDPHAPDFNPLGDGVFTAQELEESLVIGSGHYQMRDLRRDDATTGRARGGRLPGMLQNSDRQTAALGDLRGDGIPLLVTYGVINGTGSRLQVWDRAANGDYFAIETDKIERSSEVSLTCGNFDDDPMDEIAVAVERTSTRRREVWIIDDLVHGDWSSSDELPRLSVRSLGTAPSAAGPVAITTAELDGDERDELYAAFSESQWGGDVFAIDDGVADLAVLGSTSHSASGRDWISLCAPDTDGDGISEVAVAQSTPGNTTVGTDVRVDVKRLVGTSLSSAGSFMVQTFGRFDIVAHDPTGAGQDEIGYVATEILDSGGWPFGNQYTRSTFESMRRVGTTSWQLSASREFYSSNAGFRVSIASALVALEEDSDGKDEIRGTLLLASDFNQSGGEDVYSFGFDDMQISYGAETAYGFGTHERLIMIADDDDAETARLRWTGDKELFLSSPMPIVVMEAVPTKDGISQNYGATRSTFSQSSGSSQSFTTTTSTSFGITAGLSTPSLFGVFEAEAKTTITGTINQSTGVTNSVRTFTTYGSAYDVHSVVFQGTLYHSYVYEVVDAADVSAIGSNIAINVPVATNEWKWTLDKYNDIFPSDRILPGDVFSNANGATVIGEPTSYPSRAELEGLVTGPSPAFDGWIGASSTVGEGFDSNGFGLSLGTLNTTSTERTLAVDVGAQFTAGGTMWGASFGMSSGDVYTIETSSSTEYAATLGDIAPADYDDWNYEAGLVVLQNETPNAAPFQVMRYWVEPLGVAYP